MTLPTSRAEAAALGFKKFDTGRPCQAGHLSPRFTTSGSCIECARVRSEVLRKTAKRGHVSRLRGHFSYELHPDDHAKALAFCQALDLQRGLIPKSGPTAPVHRQRTPEEMKALQALALGRIPQPVEPEGFPPLTN